MGLEIKNNESAPHRAVLFIRAEVHEVTPRGDCSGRPVVRIQEFPLAVEGKDRHICERRLNEILEEFKKRCQS